MKKSEIEVGRFYSAKVSGKLTVVQVLSDYENGTSGKGYRVLNTKTGKKVLFKTAARFRGPSLDPNNRPQESSNGQKSEPSRLAEAMKGSSYSASHLIVEARAGSGKTTTLVEGLKAIKGEESKLTPSPMQKAVWDKMVTDETPNTIAFVAFNKAIATELQERVPAGVDAMTMHSMGFKAVTKAFGRKQPNSWVVTDLIGEIMEMDPREIRRKRPNLLKATERLVSLCKMNLIGFSEDHGFNSEDIDSEELGKLAAHYDVDLNGDADDVFRLVPQVLDACMNAGERGKITFDDMIWLPVVCDIPVFKYDLLLVDEAQDLNRCQQALSMKAGRRLIICGDPKQAIYGFAGADSESMPRMYDTLADTDAGCETLPLNETRRCGKAIVAEAQKIVPEFYAHESNAEGRVGEAKYNTPENDPRGDVLSYRETAEEGDMILCRVNAPLVSQCFKFIAAGRKANIRGRDIGQALVSTINKQKASDIGQLSEKLSDWFQGETMKENKKRYPNEQRLIALQDRFDCLNVFIEDETTVDGVVAKIERVFTDDKSNAGILLSSIHKAKGLESNRVFLIEPEGATVPHPMAKSAWQKEQEWNLRYVAITRAITEIVFVS